MGYMINQWKRKGAAILAIVIIFLGTIGQTFPVYGADKSALQTLVSQAEQIELNDYTDESVAFFQSALNSASQVIHDDSTSSSRINNHVTLLDTVIHALVKKTEADIVDGNYTIKGFLCQASSNNASMGNGAITQPMEITIENNEITLRLYFSSLTVPGLGQGYLSDLSYLPDWNGMLSDMTDTQYNAFQECTVEEYYEDVYDIFNDPNTGTDMAIKGQLYPKYLTMPVTYKDEEVWVKVYIPIMESISIGGGTQYARLQMDWDTLTWVSPDKSDLDMAVKQLEQLQEAVIAADYIQEMVDLLNQAVITGKYIQESTNIGQSQVDAMTQALNSVANLFADADKQYLYDMIQLADNYITSDYTDTYVANLKELLRAAQEVYNNTFATQTQVNEQYTHLLQAISNAQKKETVSDTTTTSTQAKTSTETPTVLPEATSEEAEISMENGESELDKDNLADNVYTVTGKMLKVDKNTASMSNDAINHTIKLTVKKGKYKITMDFMGLNINGSYGYLSKVKYYKTGYTLNSYGSPQGTVKAVTVDSYQLDSSGTKVSDIYGTDYPNQVTFPMIPEAVKDGYIPLQIYVPIMEAISVGTGTQPTFLYLDWSTLKSTTNDDFEDNQNTNMGSTASIGNSLIANASLIKESVSLTSGSSFTKSDITDSLSESDTSELLGTDTGALKEFTGLSTETMSSKTETMGTETVDTYVVSSGSATNSPSPAAIPTVMSVLVTVAGLLFKLKSRGGL